MRSAAIVVLGAALSWAARADAAVLSRVTIDYPEEGAVFPPEIAAPTFLWRDAAENARGVADRSDLSPTARPPSASSPPGERLEIGEIDPRAVSSNNEPPKLTPQQAAARTWMPDSAVWSEIKKHSVDHPATVTISGFRDAEIPPCRFPRLGCHSDVQGSRRRTHLLPRRAADAFRIGKGSHQAAGAPRPYR